MSAFSHRRRIAIASAGAAVLGVLLPAAAAQAAPPHGGITTVNVTSTGTFQDTGVFVRSGLVLVTATGAVFGPNGLAGPNGVPGCAEPTGVTPAAPDPGGPCDALVGRIGTTGTPFFVGNSDYAAVPSGGGELYLAVNDAGSVGGSFHATVLPLP
jgi:hypothetical protein